MQEHQKGKRTGMSTTTIVVPCYNEAQRLYTLRFREFSANNPEIRFLLVNDGSRDHTLQLLEQLQSSNPYCFEVLDLPQNCGKAEAVRRGVLHAAPTQCDFIGFWDADLATPLEAISQFTAVLDRMPEIMLALGVRLPLLGHSIQRQPLRRLLGRAFCYGASQLLGVKLADTQCGAKLFRATPEVLALFAEPFHSRWIFDVELLARLVSLRAMEAHSSLHEVVYELPLDYWEDVAGSKLKKSDFAKALVEMSAIWWHYFRPGAPGVTMPAQVVVPATGEAIGPHRRAA
jgi:glycosyltransferase involved in cell wall biosynthesis